MIKERSQLMTTKAQKRMIDIEKEKVRVEPGIPNSEISRIAFIGNYQPRQCGIATFTTDLCEAVASEYKEVSCIALPVNDIDEGYDYPERVRFELTEKDLDSYRRAAEFLNTNNVDAVSLQHEYGIYGGVAGSHILALLRELQMPVVTTLHTILENPDTDQKRVLAEVASLSDRIVTMSERGAEFLERIYNIPAEKIDHIPHGIPDVPFVDPSFNKDVFGVVGKRVLLTFGLLSASKGIETVINALPAIVEKHPDVVYIVVGATHPNVLRSEGEKYRLSLQWLAREKGVEKNVIFYNRFVGMEELIQFIGATDIYITPYLNAAQITSGTLAYTVGAGKAVISTPYWYAQELLADGRGVIVPFSDPNALANEVIAQLDNDAERQAMRKRAYLFGRDMIWSRVAQRYVESFERARAERRHYRQPDFGIKSVDRRPSELPPLRLDHLRRMTDDTGMLQHATFTIPNYREGYCIDDNARALIVATELEELGRGESFDLASRYIAFIWYAFNDETGRFRNFMDFQRNWLEEAGSEDSHGRTLWALGTVIGRSTKPSLQNMAGWLFEKGLPAIKETSSPRAWAFTLLGIHEYLKRFGGDRMVTQVRDELANRLLNLYQRVRTNDWRWYEESLTYCNAILPHALLLAGQATSNQTMTNAALESLRWLTDLQNSDRGFEPITPMSAPNPHFVPIGSNGFYAKNGERARFDQQPVEVQAIVSACLDAHKATCDSYWHNEARRAFEWFLGRNDLGVLLYDGTTGGCRDGLHPDRANENQGAESTLAFLQSLLELRLAESALTIGEEGKPIRALRGKV